MADNNPTIFFMFAMPKPVKLHQEYTRGTSWNKSNSVVKLYGTTIIFLLRLNLNTAVWNEHPDPDPRNM